MTETVHEAVDRIQQRHAGRVATIRGDQTRTEEWRRLELAKEYTEMRAELTSAQEQIVRDRADHTRRLTRRLFGTEGLPGDAASLAISQRDAADRVSRVQSLTELGLLLERADRAGDEVLARACAQQAYEMDATVVGDAFLETRPRLRDDLHELWNSGEGQPQSRQGQFQDQMAAATLRPVELRGLSDYNVEQLVKTAAVAAAG